MAEISIEDAAHGGAAKVTAEARAGLVFLNIHIPDEGDRYVFVDVRSAQRIALALEGAAQEAHVQGCETCQAARGDL